MRRIDTILALLLVSACARQGPAGTTSYYCSLTAVRGPCTFTSEFVNTTDEVLSQPVVTSSKACAAARFDPEHLPPGGRGRLFVSTETNQQGYVAGATRVRWSSGRSHTLYWTVADEEYTRLRVAPRRIHRDSLMAAGGMTLVFSCPVERTGDAAGDSLGPRDATARVSSREVELPTTLVSENVENHVAFGAIKFDCANAILKDNLRVSYGKHEIEIEIY